MLFNARKHLVYFCTWRCPLNVDLSRNHTVVVFDVDLVFHSFTVWFVISYHCFCTPVMDVFLNTIFYLPVTGEDLYLKTKCLFRIGHFTRTQTDRHTQTNMISVRIFRHTATQHNNSLCPSLCKLSYFFASGGRALWSGGAWGSGDITRQRKA